MIFSVDDDNGSAISGWLAPDNPSAIPRLLVEWGGGESTVVKATVMREDVHALGVHSTGLVGFYIDESTVPGITDPDVSLWDAETRTLIYRRFQPEVHLERKLFVFDTAVMPQREAIRALSRHFALSYFNSEKYSFETTLVLINNASAKSILMSGRSNFLRYAHYLENNNFKTAAMLRDPYEELAERLVFIRLLAASKAEHLLTVFGSGLEPLLGFAPELRFDDPKALMSSLRRATPEQRRAIGNPMCRAYGCLPEETPDRVHVAGALENLSRMDVVGIRPRLAEFQSLVALRMEADVYDGAGLTPLPQVEEVRDALSRNSLVTDLIEHDLALYSWAEEAVRHGLDSPDKDEELKRVTQV